MMSSTDTIFAPASGQVRAAIAVIRVSGPATRALIEALAGTVPPPRRLSLRRLADPVSGEVLDEALVAYMPGPHSFTGEDQAELHLHGGLATRAAVFGALSRYPGCRPAAPGEFTRRAFVQGRLDLAEVEGLADLIEAETEAQRRQALRQLEGALGSAAERWREEGLAALALLEAALDFSDEGDVPAGLEAQARVHLDRLHRELTAALAAPSGERLRDGFVVVIAGPPNAGKSTLLNVLARRDVAIVSPIAGTTRDALEVRCDLGGLPVTLIDTAGLRETADPIEREGVARARAKADSADLVLWLVPPEGTVETPPPGPLLPVLTKADLSAGQRPSAHLAVSALTGDGLPALLDTLADRARSALGAGDALLTRERHRRALVKADEAVGRALAQLGEGPVELAAEDARLAMRALGEISGRVDVEDVLDRLFASFCIGK